MGQSILNSKEKVQNKKLQCWYVYIVLSAYLWFKYSDEIISTCLFNVTFILTLFMCLYKCTKTQVSILYALYKNTKFLKKCLCKFLQH